VWKGDKREYSPECAGTSLLIILCAGDINEERNPCHEIARINYSIINNLMTILSIRGGNYLGNSHTLHRILRLLIKNRKITYCFNINIVYVT
jgi:hypothetical protein